MVDDPAVEVVEGELVGAECNDLARNDNLGEPLEDEADLGPPIGVS